MPRKANYHIDYDDEYEVYDYYEEKEYDDMEENGDAVDPGINGTGYWYCGICSCKNHINNIITCDFCGVLRNPPFQNRDNKKLVSSQNIGKDAIGSIQKATASIVGYMGADNSGSKRLNNSSPEVGEETNGHSTGYSQYSEASLDVKERLCYGLSSLLLNPESDSTGGTKSRIISPRENYTPDMWMSPVDSEDSLIQLNLAVVGHVDSGKSTLSGRLLHLTGQISQKQMHKYEQEAKLKGKGSFSYAWALDESGEERERGITMTVAVAYFDSKRYHVVLLDSPGHKDFVPNMISGAAQADAAILVIDSSPGSFEVGMDMDGGQTREHAQLIRSFGVDQIIVAVNKMEVVHYSKERFDSIKARLGTFLHSCGFKESSLFWVPLSAIHNQNLSTSASDIRLSWYEGGCLMDAIDSFKSPTRDFMKPLVIPICDVVRSQVPGQTAACGKVESGALRSGSKVMVMPSGNIGIVRSLERNSRPCSTARAGDSVAVTLQGVDTCYIEGGGVLCHPDFPIPTASHLEVKVLVLDVKIPILIGSQLELHIHHARQPARVTAISSLLDPKSGNMVKRSPRRLLSKQTAVIEVGMDREVCAEEFSVCRALGRVFLRAAGRTVAVGFVTRVIK